ncbi:MAG TPA: hypothetical protein VFU90_09640, partial [Candidatus Tumulicola sp.]|nr:hypothetical protein [Candidatus Tumulicola sp.]
MNTRTWERRACLTAAALMVAGASAFAQSARFDVTVAPSAHDGPLTGRLIVAVSKLDKPEPRLMISPRGPAIFGVDLDQLPAGHTAVVDNSASSYPMKLSALPPGDYYVEAVVNVYQQFHRSDGHTIWVHMGDGRVEFFNFAGGNLYSDVQKVHIDGHSTVHLTVTHVIPVEPRPADTEWLKHVKIQSQLLTTFWGHPVYIY